MIYGVDVGMRRVAVVGPSTLGAYELVLPPSTPNFRRVIAEWIRETVPSGHTLWIEAPIAGLSGNVQTAVKIAMTVGAVLTYDGDTELVAPSSWKKAVIGHGHADKAATAAWLDEYRPALAKACQGSEDLRDAACVGIYGEMRARGEVEAPRSVPKRRRPRAVLRPPGLEGPDEQADGR